MRRLNAVLAGIAILAVAVPAIVVRNAPSVPRRVKLAKLPPPRVVPRTVVPDVEPTAFVDLTPEDARSYNAGVPFSTAPNPAARPFRIAGGPEDVARATDCMAAAVLYEAGDDAIGERAVAQVVLNRLRHPAFPKTVCGVVFQGSERTTGCQFTFTCDGALARTPSEPGWRRAREIATLALKGAVYKPVGYSTHYHTDWVVPYWQASLDKVTAVHTHLFFRWTGWWGTPPAFDRQVSTSEPVVAALAPLSEAHRSSLATGLADAMIGQVVLATDTPGSTPPTPVPGGAAPLPADPNSFLVTLESRDADAYPGFAARLCGDRVRCVIFGWTDGTKTAAALPLREDQVTTLSFSYLRDRVAGFERLLWNCTEFRRANPAQCMKRQVLRPEAAEPPRPQPSPVAELGGVRRRELPAPVPTPAPATPSR